MDWRITLVHGVSGWGNTVPVVIVSFVYLYVAAYFSTIATSMGDLEICLTHVYVAGMSKFAIFWSPSWEHISPHLSANARNDLALKRQICRQN